MSFRHDHRPDTAIEFATGCCGRPMEGRQDEAIKIVRLERDVGLKEAKDAVDAYLRTQPDLQRRVAATRAEQNQGCLRWLAAITVLLVLAVYWLSTRGS